MDITAEHEPASYFQPERSLLSVELPDVTLAVLAHGPRTADSVPKLTLRSYSGLSLDEARRYAELILQAVEIADSLSGPTP